MPRNRARRKDIYWETSEAEETSGNDLGDNGIGSRVIAGEVDERGDDNDHHRDVEVDIASNRLYDISNEHPRKGRVRPQSQNEHQNGLGSWTQAVSGTVQSLGVAHRALNGLQKTLTSHLNDLSKMEETQNRVILLEEERRGNAEAYKRLENTITTLTSMDQKAKANIISQQAEIEKEKKELAQERTKQEKRVSAVIAEERLKLKTEFDTLVTRQGESHDKRKKELEDECSRRKEESGKRVATLEAEKNKLLATAQEQKRTIEVQLAELDKIKEQCDVLERAKNSVKKEKKDLEAEIEAMKQEFALSPKSITYLYVFWPYSSHQQYITLTKD